MKSAKIFFKFACFTPMLFCLSVSPVYPSQTFVVVADVVFMRENQKTVSPLENMTIDELREAYWRMNDFPFYRFYGENITGEIDKADPTVVKTTVTVQGKAGKESVVKYAALDKLWPEPLLTAPIVDRHMTTQNTDVYLLPDSTSRKVLSLYQGEVVEVAGSLKAGDVSWSKARFCNEWAYYGDEYGPKYEDLKAPYAEQCSRYGYIRTDVLFALLPGAVNESILTNAEIPVTMRSSNLTLSDAARARLGRDGFYVEEIIPNGKVYVDDMVDRYHALKSSRFITSDLYLHVFHLIFDRMLQNIEEQRIYPEIEGLTKKMVSESEKELKSYTGGSTQIRKALLHNLFFFSVAAKLLDRSFRAPAVVQSDVRALVDTITKAEGPLPSFTNRFELGNEDFTQYRPRGHYMSKNSAHGERKENPYASPVNSDDPDRLERYFRAMMWYGRHAFLLSDDAQTVSAILISRALESSGEMARWKRIDSALKRLVGKIDDWSPEDYGKVIIQIFGKDTPGINDIAKDAQIKAFQSLALKILPQQRIVSMQTGPGLVQEERVKKTAAFKFLGQRFTPDAYIFNQLTSPSVGSDADPRNLPTSLDVMALLGSEAAAAILEDSMKSHDWMVDYHSQAGKIRKEINEEVAKRETSYSGWLHTLTGMFRSTDSRQVFAAGAPWQYKVLNTAVGSWTELKHDTILYSEQSYAESGSGDEFYVPSYEPPYVKGYVEPAPLFFNRLHELVTALRADLQQNNLLTAEYDDKLQTFTLHVKKAGEIAGKEIEGIRMTRDDYRWIEIMINSFDRRLLLPRDAGDIVDPDTLKMALIADVATDAVSGRVLEVAVGVPQRIVVAVKDLSGGTRTCVGYVYSWYEFDDTKRWTDQEWKSLVYGGDQTRLVKLAPSWYSEFRGDSGPQPVASQGDAEGQLLPSDGDQANTGNVSSSWYSQFHGDPGSARQIRSPYHAADPAGAMNYTILVLLCVVSAGALLWIISRMYIRKKNKKSADSK